MEFIVIPLLFIFLASVVVTPAHLLTNKEKAANLNLSKFHVAGNALFIAWAFYDINYTHHYMHGPNTSFIIIPGTIGLLLYYLFGYRKVLKASKIPHHALLIACMHIGFIIYGVTFHS